MLREPTRRRKSAPCAASLASPPRIVRSFRSFIEVSRSRPASFEPVLSKLASDGELVAVERFGVTAGRIAFHAPQSHQREEGFGLKPALVALRLEGFEDAVDLSLACLCIERHKHAGLAQIAVIFWDLILQNQVIAKGVPG